MINLEEMSKLSVDDINKEINSRRDRMKDMVGWLYPSILQGEINQLCEIRYEKLYKKI